MLCDYSPSMVEIRNFHGNRSADYHVLLECRSGYFQLKLRKNFQAVSPVWKTVSARNRYGKMFRLVLYQECSENNQHRRLRQAVFPPQPVVHRWANATVMLKGAHSFDRLTCSECVYHAAHVGRPTSPDARACSIQQIG